MAIPNFEIFMLPTLNILADGKEYNIYEINEKVAETLNLNDKDKEELTPSGKQKLFLNRSNWARTYLNKAGLIESLKRAHFQITPLGKIQLKKELQKIDKSYLMQFPSFLEFINKSNKDLLSEKNLFSHKTQENLIPQRDSDLDNKVLSGTDMLEDGYQEHLQTLENDLLSKLKNSNSRFFEKVAKDLIEKMGYGAGELTNQTRDGGIDGIIYQDELGLEKIYLQAKQYDNAKISSPEIDRFAGVLSGKQTSKGVFITTSDFTPDAIKNAESNTKVSIRLINGYELVKLMIKHNLGVQIKQTYEIKKIDNDYFDENID